MTAEGGRNNDDATVVVCSTLVMADEEDEDAAIDTCVGIASSGRRPLAAKYVDDVVCWSTHAANGEPLPPPLP